MAGPARLTDKEIGELDSYEPPNHDPGSLKSRSKRRAFALKLDAFLKAEGALAWARMSYRPNGLLHGEGYTGGKNDGWNHLNGKRESP